MFTSSPRNSYDDLVERSDTLPGNAVAQLTLAGLISSRRTASTESAVFQQSQAPTWEYEDGIHPLIDQTLGTTGCSLERAAV